MNKYIRFVADFYANGTSLAILSDKIYEKFNVKLSPQTIDYNLKKVGIKRKPKSQIVIKKKVKPKTKAKKTIKKQVKKIEKEVKQISRQVVQKKEERKTVIDKAPTEEVKERRIKNEKILSQYESIQDYTIKTQLNLIKQMTLDYNILLQKTNIAQDIKLEDIQEKLKLKIGSREEIRKWIRDVQTALRELRASLTDEKELSILNMVDLRGKSEDDFIEYMGMAQPKQVTAKDEEKEFEEKTINEKYKKRSQGEE